MIARYVYSKSNLEFNVEGFRHARACIPTELADMYEILTESRNESTFTCELRRFAIDEHLIDWGRHESGDSVIFRLNVQL